MKYSLAFIAFITLFFYSCSEGQPEANMAPAQFNQKLKETTDAQLVDVRTPEEYAKGHLANSRNINYNGDDFSTEIARLDKSKPVFVYCLSGVRSHGAAKIMRSEGFAQVYELQGGIIKWRAEGMPEAGAKKGGMTQQEFANMIAATGDKQVVVDFYAEWCAPCRKMKPYLEALAKEKATKINVVRINADDNQELCRQVGVSSLPLVQVYKNAKMIWSYNGYVSKEELLTHIQ